MEDHESLRLLVAEPDASAAVLSAVFHWKLKSFGSHRMRRQEARKDEARQLFRRHLWVSDRKVTGWRSFDGSMKPDVQNFLWRLHSLVGWVDALLRGIGQVMLCNNPLTGLLIFVGVCIGEWWIGVNLLLGLVTATLMARGMQYDIRDGLWSFNGALCGAFFADSLQQWDPLCIIAVVVASITSVLAQAALSNIFTPVLTLPFNISGLVIWAALRTGSNLATLRLQSQFWASLIIPLERRSSWPRSEACRRYF